MDTRQVSGAVGVVGAVAVALGILAPWWIPFLRGAPWLLVAVGAVYAASGGTAWALLGGDRGSFALAFAPVVLAPVLTLISSAGGDVVGAIAGPELVTLSAVAVVFGMALSFPLGVATRPRQQWSVVGALGLAAVVVIAAALSALSPGPPEDRDLLVLVGMVALPVATVLAIPTYVLGRSVRRRVAAAHPSPYPGLAAAALPFALVLAGFVPAPYFARETIYGPWPVIVPAVALLAIVAQFVRVRGRR